MSPSTVIVGCLLLALPCSAWLLPTRTNEIPLEHAAVASIGAQGALPGHPNTRPLLLTTFYPFGSDSVNVVADAGAFVNGKATNATTLDSGAKWPNQADFAPSGAVAAASPGSSFVLTAGGFFVSPSKSTGEIDLLELGSASSPGAAATKIKISTDRKANFYHHAEWHDLNGDGRLDVLAARAYKSMNPFSKAESDLVWLEQPADGAAGTWVERQLTDFQGPGVAFTAVDLDGDGKVEVVAAQFFAKQQLSVWWCGETHWSKCCENGTSVGSAVIDDAEKSPYFNVQYVDLNGDGKKDLLATTNEANGKGSVLAFELPAGGDFRKPGAAWAKHKLADGYKPKKAYLPGRGSPGTAIAFHVNASEAGSAKPQVLVSADDGGFVDLLVASSPDASDWTYAKHRVVNSTDTVGTPAVGDVNNDGIADFFVPLFAENKVAAYTFK